jgi:peptide/nickel transport system substrate-binding protein
MGDFLMYMIYQFARSVEGSPIYDEATAGSYAAFLRYHKGFRITSTDPLTIETYSDYYGLDAESSITTWWPEYAQGPGAWHNIAIGQLAEIDGALAFSEDKATTLEVEWMSYVSGPSMDILAGYLAQAITDNYIPFAGFMGDYITAEEATTRYANLQTWYDTYGHFWLGAGPYYLYAVYPVEESVLVKHNANYVDLADKWARFSAPMFATVDIDGDATVTVGDTATFDAMVTFDDEAYPSDLIDSVTFLVFDATGALAIEGVADFVDEGEYQATVDTTSLVAGGNKITFVVVSKAIAIPTFESFEFVTTE